MGINMKNFLILFLSISCSQAPIKTELLEVKPAQAIELEKLEIALIESRFEIVRELPYFKEVIKVADCVINLKEFQDEIAKIESFGNTKESGEQVKNTMLLPVKAKLRYYWYFKKSVIAKTIKDEVYINTKSNPRKLADMVNTFIHERLHVLGYKHVSKWNIGRDKDNAYVIGDLSEKYVEQCDGK
jgi:hypothetical protein